MIHPPIIIHRHFQRSANVKSTAWHWVVVEVAMLHIHPVNPLQGRQPGRGGCGGALDWLLLVNDDYINMFHTGKNDGILMGFNGEPVSTTLTSDG